MSPTVRRSRDRRERLRAKLGEAIDTHALVTLSTGRHDPLVGYCVAVGRRWALLRLAAPWPAGLVAVRLARVTRLRRDPEAVLERRAFEHEGAWPPAPVEGLDMDRTADLIAGLADRHPLLALELRMDEDDLFVGTPMLVAEGTLLLHELSADLEWDAVSTWRLRDVERVRVGDRYLDLLAELAPPRPDQPSPFTD